MLESNRHRLKLIVISDLGADRDQEYDFSGKEIFIGRVDSEIESNTSTLNLDSDLAISRKHARVWFENGKWYIEDGDSKHGTCVDGHEIKGSGVKELAFGSIIQTGETAWIILPANWVFIRWGDIIIFGPCATGINYAMYHCGTPIVGLLTAKNLGQQESTAINLRMQVIGFSDRCNVTIPCIPPGASVSLGVPSINLHGHILRKQVVRIRARLLAHIEGKLPAKTEKDVTILGFWDWIYDATATKTIAAFVSPRNLVIERIAIGAQTTLKKLTEFDDFQDLLKSGQADVEKLAIQAIYEYLNKQWRIHYVVPELEIDPEGIRIIQTVKPPHRIFIPNLLLAMAKATCLDLALLVAGCLENIGLNPLVFFTGDEIDKPRHAFAGCWTGSVPGGRPVIYDADFLNRQVEKNNLIVIECTGFAKGISRQWNKLSFEKAVKSANKQLKNTPWVCAVDIGSLRPPYGSITPMESPLEPEVGQAYDEAKRIAKTKSRETIETTYLLYGCLAARGEVVESLFTKAGLGFEKIRLQIERLINTHTFSEEPTPTQNYLDCCRFAEDIARHMGSPTVREQDLLWAIFTKGQGSVKFCTVCRKIKVDINLLANLLSECYSYPETPVTSPYTIGLDD